MRKQNLKSKKIKLFYFFLCVWELRCIYGKFILRFCFFNPIITQTVSYFLDGADFTPRKNNEENKSELANDEPVLAE